MQMEQKSMSPAFLKSGRGESLSLRTNGQSSDVRPRYCEQKSVGDWEATLKDLQRETTMDFMLFVCGNYNVTSWGTTHVYMRHFQQLYTTVTGRYMDRNDAKEVYKLL
jgi:hypothetical protein